MKRHQVKQGDCISSIAEREGFFWETLWDAPDNADLRQLRQEPNLLCPRDVVVVPDLRTRQEQGATETRHRFRKKGVPAVLRIILEFNDQPVANKPYVLTIDGTPQEGTTSDIGLVEAAIPPDACEGRLECDGLEYDLDLGCLDPADEATGIQARLENLGFYDGAVDGDIGDVTREALAEFQAEMDLEATGELDDETRQQLYQRQDEEHETPVDDEDTDEPEEPQSGPAEDDEDTDDSDGDDSEDAGQPEPDEQDEGEVADEDDEEPAEIPEDENDDR